MKRFLWILCLSCSISICSWAAEEIQTVVIHAGNLLAIPGESPAQQQSIILRDNRIDAVVDGYVDPASLPGQVELVDLSDKFVLPGLIDMHVHMLSEISPSSRNDALYITTSMSAMRGVYYAGITLDAGFTTVRDLGSEPEAIYALRDAINQGLVSGPTIFAAGSSLAATGGHGDVDGYIPELLEMWTPETICDGPIECRAATREAIKFGAQWIKITATGGVLSDTATGLGQQMTDDELTEIVATAHNLGIKVAAHAHGADGINAALRAGVDSIDHGTYLDQESIRLFNETGAYLVPTLLPGIKLPESMEGNPFFTDDIKDKAYAAGAAAADNIAAAYRGGVNIAFGTDSAVTPHGLNGEEFRYMVQIGITEMDAIHSATIGAATLLSQLENLGTIEAGKIADIIAVDSNPLNDITELERVSTVIKSGKLIKNL
ncbi:MAG: amidohydrolase family protein [Gammaproteobacteria bacterium]|nr:amidohydrolase family protein [Gammaproteobacteria bacterium]MDD9894602.1 amidohydrolase family protein [Gammaproteobacteria bacterium]MDD9957850.1 amidohydrolase family protein [Gammaproteobacteria bacterium]